MSEETLKIKVVVDNQASSAINNIKQQFNKTTETTKDTSASVEEVVRALSGLRGTSVKALALQFTNLQRSCKDVGKTFKNLKLSLEKAPVKLRISKEIENLNKIIDPIQNKINTLKKSLNDANESFNTGRYSSGNDWLNARKNLLGFNRSNGNEIRYLEKQIEQPLARLKELKKYDVGSAWKDFKYNVQSTLAPLKTVINLLTRIFILSTMIKSAVKEIKSAIQVAANGDEVRDNAQKVFMSATAYQEWGYVLKQNGIEISQLNTVMRTFAKNATSNAALLRKYGIEAESVQDAFTQAVFRIQNMETETEKIAAATELFGNRAMQLMPLLNSDNEAVQQLMKTYRLLGGTMSDQLVSAGDRLTDSIVELKAAWQGLKNTLATAILPVIQKIVTFLTLAVGYIRIIVKAILGINETFGGLNDGAAAAGKLGANLDAAAGSAGKLKRILMGYDELNRLEGSDGGAGAGIGDLGLDTSEFDSLGNFFNNSEILDKLEAFRDKIEKIKEILRLATPALMTGIGLIGALLAFSHGDILGGIAFLGLAGMGIALGNTNGAWGDIFGAIGAEWEKHKVGLIGIAAALAGLACLATGHLGIGIPLVALGLTAFTVDYSAGGWNTFFESISNAWKRHQILITGIAFALCGLAAIATGNFLLGIPLLAAGGIMIGTDVYGSGQWGNFFEDIKRVWQEHNATFVGIASALIGLALLTRGIILPGIALMAAGGIIIAADVNGNGWGVLFETIKSELKNHLATLAGIASVFIGLYMLTHGLIVPGIAMMAAGGIMMTVDQTIGWGSVFNDLKSWFDQNKAFVIGMASVFAGLWMIMRGMVVPGAALMVAGGCIIAIDNGWGWDNIFSSLDQSMSNINTKVSNWVTKINKKLKEIGVSYKSTINLDEHGNNAAIKLTPQATGGVWTTPTPALLAEYPGAKSNPEIVAPQSILEQTINASNGELANAFAQGVRQIVSAIESKDDTVIIGEETIARAAGKGNASHIKRTGVSLI